MTGVKSSVWLIVLWIFCGWCVPCVQAQDLLPDRLQALCPQVLADSVFLYGTSYDRIEFSYSLPASFKGLAPNVVTDSVCSLAPFWEKLRTQRSPVRIVHIGDSHIRGHVFPLAVRRQLEHAFGSEAVLPDSITYFSSGLARETGRPGVVYHMIGINGATIRKFSNPMQVNEIAGLYPDLLILSFGTNESHGRGYLPVEHRRELDEFFRLFRQACPQSCVLLTTPPGSYIRYRRRYSINMRTSLVAKTLVDYAADKGYAIWDLYRIVGGKERACLNWWELGYMRRDHIHFTREGYIVQGNLLYEALIKAYNDYVSD